MARDLPTCPTCESTLLRPSRLADDLDAYACPACAGNWVQGQAYFDWLSAQPATATSINEAANTPIFGDGESDTKGGKLCLDCGRYMRRVAVGYGVRFHLDRCTACGGFWFDAKEWDALRESGIHRDAHKVFTDAWQTEVRRQAYEQAEHDRLENRLGSEGLTRLEEIKSWIAGHPRGDEILAALRSPSDK